MHARNMFYLRIIRRARFFANRDETELLFSVAAEAERSTAKRAPMLTSRVPSTLKLNDRRGPSALGCRESVGEKNVFLTQVKLFVRHSGPRQTTPHLLPSLRYTEREKTAETPMKMMCGNIFPKVLFARRRAPKHRMRGTREEKCHQAL